MELMIVIIIVTILVMIALPTYDNSIRKTRRADAQSKLMKFAGDAERIYTQSNSYETVALPANTGYYTYTFPVAVRALQPSLRWVTRLMN